MGHSTTLTSANRSPTRRHTRCLPSALCSENQDSSVKSTPLQSTRRHRMWAFAHSSRLQRRTAVRSRPRRGRRACRWASLRWFLTVCAEIAQLYISLLIILCIIYYVTNKETLKSFGYANRLLQQLSGWLVSDDLGGEDTGCGGPGLVWLHVVCGCEAGWMYCKILWNTLEMVYGK